MAHRVLVSDSLAEEGLEVFRRAEGIEVDVETSLSPEELKAVLVDYDAIAIRSGTKLTGEIIGGANRLKVIGRAGIGVDNVDIAAASKKGIVVMNTPEGNTITTAELTISMLLALARRIPQANASVKGGKWERKKFMGTEVFNKTLGIVGMGRIGEAVARRAVGFGMRILYADRTRKAQVEAQIGAQYATLDDLLREVDFVTLHTPLTPETQHLIGAQQFALMKPTAILVNTARGGVVDGEALYHALRDGRIAAAGIDVTEPEPIPPDSPLLTLPNLIIVPHIASSSRRTRSAMARMAAENLLAGLRGERLPHPANPQIYGA